MNNTIDNNNNNPKYLIIVTLVDGQNFTIPDGVPDKIEATVFAEARFGSESVLRSDPIKLVNSNPEFSTELAWQLDRKSLHQLRIERRAIKLQVFMQTKTRKKTKSQGIGEPDETEINSDNLSGTNKIELIGYTVIKIRAAQESEVPKFEWLPLLNPKFRKSSYNRPEVQLALTLTKVDENAPTTTMKTTRNDVYKHHDFNAGSNSEYSDSNPSDLQAGDDSLLNDSNKLYKTCIETTQANNDETGDYDDKDEILENDIQIHSRDGNFYIYDIRNLDKFAIDDCDKSYKILVTIPFNSDLDLLLTRQQDHAKDYYFSINLFGSSIKMRSFEKLTRVETAEIEIYVFTTHSSILTTYFELNPSLVIKFHHGQTNRILGLADIQVDQLCSLEAKRRSVEGIFALQPASDNEEIPSPIHPTIGVSVVLEKVLKTNGVDSSMNNDREIRNLNNPTTSDNFNEHFGEDVDALLYESFENTHQLTLEKSSLEDGLGVNPNGHMGEGDRLPKIDRPVRESYSQQTITNQGQTNRNQICDNDDHHFCFTIDLKNFSYTQNQRLIPTLRELVVRYSYPFFGYKDTITTDASIPISPTNSIIVSGFCEFNFATTYESLLAALNEIPLHLKILTCDHPSSRRILNTIVNDDTINSNGVNQAEMVVATCNLNLAEILGLPIDISKAKLIEDPISKTVSAPIFCLDGENNGQLQVYLCLKDLGPPTYHHHKDPIDTNNERIHHETNPINTSAKESETQQHQQEQIELNEDYIKESIQNSLTVDQKSATITKYSASDYQPKLLAFMEEVRNDLDSWRDRTYKALSDDMKARETEIIRRLQQKFDIKDSKREQEFKDKMRSLNTLEKKFKTSLTAIDSLEKMLRSGFETLKKNNTSLDVKLETIETKITKAIKDIKLIDEQQGRQQSALSKRDSNNKFGLEELHPAPQLQPPGASIVPPAKKLSFYPSKYSRSSEGNLILSANTCDPATSGLIRKTGQLNHITQSSNLNNGISRAGSNTRISSGVTVIDVSPGGTRRPSLRQTTTKWPGNGTSTSAAVGTSSSQARTSSTSRIGAGQIPRVR